MYIIYVYYIYIYIYILYIYIIYIYIYIILYIYININWPSKPPYWRRSTTRCWARSSQMEVEEPGNSAERNWRLTVDGWRWAGSRAQPFFRQPLFRLQRPCNPRSFSPRSQRKQQDNSEKWTGTSEIHHKFIIKLNQIHHIYVPFVSRLFHRTWDVPSSLDPQCVARCIAPDLPRLSPLLRCHRPTGDAKPQTPRLAENLLQHLLKNHKMKPKVAHRGTLHVQSVPIRSNPFILEVGITSAMSVRVLPKSMSSGTDHHGIAHLVPDGFEKWQLELSEAAFKKVSSSEGRDTKATLDVNDEWFGLTDVVVTDPSNSTTWRFTTFTTATADKMPKVRSCAPGIQCLNSHVRYLELVPIAKVWCNCNGQRHCSSPATRNGRSSPLLP